MVIRTDAIAKRISEVEGRAASAFKDHSIKTLLDHGLYRHFRCAKAGECAYAFNISTIPGRLIITGDIGSLILERTEDMIPWCRGSINSIAYFAEKVTREFRIKEYDPELAREYIDEELADEERTADDRDILQELKWHCDNEWAFVDELHDSGLIDGCDFPNLTNYRYSFLWCREAIKWFLANYQVEVVKEAGV